MWEIYCTPTSCPKISELYVQQRSNWYSSDMRWCPILFIQCCFNNSAGILIQAFTYLQYFKANEFSGQSHYLGNPTVSKICLVILIISCFKVLSWNRCMVEPVFFFCIIKGHFKTLVCGIVFY